MESTYNHYQWFGFECTNRQFVGESFVIGLRRLFLVRDVHDELVTEANIIDVQSSGRFVVGTPWALATASTCCLASDARRACFHAEMRCDISLLCASPPFVRSMPRSGPILLNPASVSSNPINVSRSVIMLTRKELMRDSSTLSVRRRFSDTGSRSRAIASCSPVNVNVLRKTATMTRRQIRQ